MDTIGVYEFDAVSNTIAGSHNIDPANEFGAYPAVSPDGQHFLLFGADGGECVTVMTPGATEENSVRERLSILSSP